jgi:hypothetical protein
LAEPLLSNFDLSYCIGCFPGVAAPTFGGHPLTWGTFPRAPLGSADNMSKHVRGYVTFLIYTLCCHHHQLTASFSGRAALFAQFFRSAILDPTSVIMIGRTQTHYWRRSSLFSRRKLLVRISTATASAALCQGDLHYYLLVYKGSCQSTCSSAPSTKYQSLRRTSLLRRFWCLSGAGSLLDRGRQALLVNR